MNKISVTTRRGTFSWGMNTRKYFCGSDDDCRHAIIQSLYAYIADNYDTEYADDGGHLPRIMVDDNPLPQRETFLITITPHFDFAAQAKMTNASPLSILFHATTQDVPYDDMYAMFQSAYECIANDSIGDATRITNGDTVEINYGMAPITLKTLAKFAKPTLRKEGKEAGTHDLTLNESIAIQCAMVETIARKTDKYIIAIYDGVINDGIVRIMHNRTLPENCLFFINAHGNFYPPDIRECFICGVRTFDCVDECAITQYVEMEMSYNGTEEDALRDISAYIAGRRGERQAYLEKIL